MVAEFDPKDYPLALLKPRRLMKQSYWLTHIPFAFALTQMLEPRVFVELGTHRGDSYLAFCQAVEELGLATKCYAVDTWAGDVHTGEYADTIFTELKAYHDPRYGEFSTLLKCLFDEALDQFDERSIDLLHIDGTHTYEAVRHDFDSWLPKMSDRGVIIMHDVAEYREGFGVWRVWDEVKAQYPHFEFPYGHGLGVAAVGSEIPEAVKALVNNKSNAPETVHYFSMLGERVEAMAEERAKQGTSVVEDYDLDVPTSPLLADESVSQSTPRVLAFYLPQFYPVPENDLWWGKGFTEWTNVVQAKPLYEGHEQPHLPADLGFYDLRLPEVRQAQADLAREYGISGFCYYHYWFKGRRILDRPLDEMLASGEPDFPFCLCWANHTWTSHWSSSKVDRLVEQEYSEEDDRDHIRWLLSVFEEERYIKIDGRPLLLIYRAQDLPNPSQTIDLWKKETRKAGMPEPYICKVESGGDFTDPREIGCDAAVEFPPHKTDPPVKRVQGSEDMYKDNRIFEYRELVEKRLDLEEPPFRRFPCVMPSFDNTPRYRDGGAMIYRGSTPGLYQQWLEGAIRKTLSNPLDEQIVFVNAWNEWGEGNHLEPDVGYGHAYLEATRNALRESGIEVPSGASAVHGNSDSTATQVFTLEERYRDLLNKYTVLQQSMTEALREGEAAAIPFKIRDNYERREQENKELAQENRRTKARNEFFRSKLRESNQETTKLSQKNEKLAQGVRQAKARNDFLRSKLRESNQETTKLSQRLKKKTKEVRQKTREVRQLTRWMEQVDSGLEVLFSSQRWKLGSIAGDAGRRVLLKSRIPTAADRLRAISDEFHAWRNGVDGEDGANTKEENPPR